MRSALIPVKDLSWANERLSEVLIQELRTELAYAMLSDVLRALGGSELLDRIYIVTLDKNAINIAEEFGVEVILEEEQAGESSSVDYGSRICMELGSESVLVIPGDAPLITSEDIDSVLAEDCPDSKELIILVPSRDELGTNAIFRKPPDAIASQFGHDSYRKHKALAEQNHIPYKTLVNPRIGLDIDNPDDLQAFLENPSDTDTFRALIKIGYLLEATD